MEWNFLHLEETSGSNCAYIHLYDTWWESLLTHKRLYQNNEIEIPDIFELSQNYPNPFNPGTVIEYRLAEGSHVTLKIFNSLGQEIEILVDEFKEAGSYSISYITNNLPSGVYLYQIQAGNFSDTKKMILLR